MKILIQCLSVGAAGFVGAISRYLIGVAFGRMVSTNFPLGTFVINITGSFILGWLSTRVFRHDEMRIALAVGFVGAYTTFSTFMFESDALLKEGAFLMAATNLIGSLVIGLLAVRLGVHLGTR